MQAWEVILSIVTRAQVGALAFPLDVASESGWSPEDEETGN